MAELSLLMTPWLWSGFTSQWVFDNLVFVRRALALLLGVHVDLVDVSVPSPSSEGGPFNLTMRCLDSDLSSFEFAGALVCAFATCSGDWGAAFEGFDWDVF